MKREVKLVAIDIRYKKSSYPFRCVYDEGLKTYRTGQHINPDNPDTLDNLTVDEMTGKEKLSEEKRKRFPYVINPLGQINFFNGQKFDVSKNKAGEYVNHQHAALLNLIRNEAWFVAPSRDKVIPRTHYFYIQDDIFEAEQRIISSDLSYRAEKYIREEITEDKLKDIAMLLGYKIKDFNLDPALTTTLILKDKILSLCKTKPEKVLECKDPGSKEDLYVLKLALHSIITRRGTDFYDGSEFLGKDLETVKRMLHLEANNARVSKWNRLLAEKEGRVSNTPDDALRAKRDTIFNEVENLSVEELHKYAGNRRYPKIEWAELSEKDTLIKYLLAKVK